VNPTVLAAVAAACALLGRPGPTPPPAVPLVARLAPTAAAGVAQWLDDAGGVVAFGELHQDTAGAGTRSALARFADDILPVIAPRASHLIVETWMTSGACGAAERQVTADVARTTRRPAETENEIVRLLRRARELGVAPHILEIGCDEYRALQGGGVGSSGAGGVDYDKLLELTGRHLGVAIRQALLLPRSPRRPLVLVYGGALHNDLYPDRETARYSFGPASYALARGAYREIDLFVPEYALRLAALRAERWYPVWRRRRQEPGAVLIPRSAASLIVVFPPAH
jgi:hypothetical protein